MGKPIAFVLCVSLCCVESYRIFPLPGQSEAPLNPKFGLFNFKSASSSLVTVTSPPKLLPITPSRTTVAPSIPIPTSKFSSNIASSTRSETPTSLNRSVQKFSSNFASTESQKIGSVATNYQKQVEHLATDVLPPKKVSVTPAPKPLPTISHHTSGTSQVSSLASRLSGVSQNSAAPKTPNAAVNRLSSNVAPQTSQNGPKSNHVETLARDLLPPKEDVKTTVGRSPVKQALQPLATDLLPPKTS